MTELIAPIQQAYEDAQAELAIIEQGLAVAVQTSGTFRECVGDVLRLMGPEAVGGAHDLCMIDALTRHAREAARLRDLRDQKQLEVNRLRGITPAFEVAVPFKTPAQQFVDDTHLDFGYRLFVGHPAGYEAGDDSEACIQLRDCNNNEVTPLYETTAGVGDIEKDAWPWPLHRFEAEELFAAIVTKYGLTEWSSVKVADPLPEGAIDALIGEAGDPDPAPMDTCYDSSVSRWGAFDTLNLSRVGRTGTIYSETVWHRDPTGALADYDRHPASRDLYYCRPGSFRPAKRTRAEVEEAVNIGYDRKAGPDPLTVIAPLSLRR